MFQGMGSMLEIPRIQSEINRLFENLLEIGGSGGREGGAAWMPNADIIEGPDQLTVCVELPGVAAGELRLSVDGGNVILRGCKEPPPDRAVLKSHVAERPYGVFERVISLNAAINTHRATATLRDGLLKIVFPKVNNRRGGEVGIPVTEG